MIIWLTNTRPSIVTTSEKKKQQQQQEQKQQLALEGDLKFKDQRPQI